MEFLVLLFILLNHYGVTAKGFDERIPIYAHEEDEIILLLPEHLLNHISYVSWKKGEEEIAEALGNGSLYFPDPSYSEILSSSQFGSLIIKARSWKDGEQYTANITLLNNTCSSICYRVSVDNYKYIPHRAGPINVSAKAGEDLTLPLDRGINLSEIEEIDWLTEKWVYFAATRVDGTIRILEIRFIGSLSSSDGSLVFRKVTMNDQGIYRACILLRRGTIVEQKYQVHISAVENYFEGNKDIKSTHPKIPEMIFLVLSVCLFVISSSCIICLLVKPKRLKKTVSGSSEVKEMKTMSHPSQCNKTKKSHDIKSYDPNIKQYSALPDQPHQCTLTLP